MQPRWNGVSYVCPYHDCNSLPSVSIEAIAIKTDIIEGLFERLRR